MAIQTPPGLAQFTDTYLWIDQSFLIQELFNWDWDKDRMQIAQNQAYDGTLRLYAQFFKDQFQITFPKLTWTQRNQLKQLVELTGTGILHTVQYGTPSQVYLYDAVTTPGYNVNMDLTRIRKKVWFDQFQFPHWVQQNGFWSATLHGVEA